MRKWICGIAAVLLMAALAVPGRAAVTGLEGKKLSILGDSISTYAAVSNNAGVNITLGEGSVFYDTGSYGIHQEDTWWQQAVDELGLRLLVNNSWSGSCMFRDGAGTLGAYVSRCVQLHNSAGETPDIIAVFLGTNDQDYFPDTIGAFADIDFDHLIREEEGISYEVPSTTMEAYAITLDKIARRYPQAEVYCFNLLQRPFENPESLLAFNQELEKLTKHFDVNLVDLFDCGIRSPIDAFGTMMVDSVHPGPLGMDAITGAFVSAILRSSRYVAEEARVCDITYGLKNVMLARGERRVVLAGSAFRDELIFLGDSEPKDIRVLMAGRDITRFCYTDGVISIGYVTGDIRIIAR